MKFKFLTKSTEYLGISPHRTVVLIGNDEGASIPYYLDKEAINLTDSELFDMAMEKMYQITCKREGDRITVDIYKLNITQGTNQGIGTLPVGFRPNHELMFNVPSWAANGEIVKLQIGPDGGMIVLGQSISANREVSTQVDFSV